MYSDSFTGLTYIVTCDLGGVCRGRAVPNVDSERWGREGTGWVPASIAMSPLGRIIEPNAFGVLGDLRLVPDATTRAEIPAVAGRPAVTLVLGDLVETDGREWACSSRAFLRHAVADLAAETGLTLLASFEHEFTLLDDSPDAGAGSGSGAGALAPLSLQSLRQVEPLGSELVRALSHAGLRPETWHPEYGPNQWEITVAATDAASAADRAILVREVVRHVADAHGRRVTFTPVPDDGVVGNGVHVHLSLRTGDGGSATSDPDAVDRLSPVAEMFVAGILRHAGALVALTAPSPVSAARFGPGRWSVDAARAGYRDREAMVRICPILELPGCTPTDHLNIEYRAADATANPWLVLGVLIRAGLEGIRAQLPLPASSGAEAAGASAATPLPASLAEALAALEADETVVRWFPPELLATYLLIKHDEVRAADADPVDTLRARYARIY